MFERVCPTHGTGHPDPDQTNYWRLLGMDFMSVHGCCGCCHDGGTSVPAGKDIDGPGQGGKALLSVSERVCVP